MTSFLCALSEDHSSDCSTHITSQALSHNHLEPQQWGQRRTDKIMGSCCLQLAKSKASSLGSGRDSVSKWIKQSNRRRHLPPLAAACAPAQHTLHTKYTYTLTPIRKLKETEAVTSSIEAQDSVVFPVFTKHCSEMWVLLPLPCYTALTFLKDLLRLHITPLSGVLMKLSFQGIIG